jgi:Flp pilus assembly protein TadG
MKQIGVLRAIYGRKSDTSREAVTQSELARSPISSAIARTWRDERGVSAVVIALGATALIGFAGLGVETGLWYSIKRQNQSAADAAAISAAYEVLANKTNVSTDLTPAATSAASQNGYTGTTPVVTYPYTDSIVSAADNAVAVTLQTTKSTSLAGLFLPSVTIQTKAVARVYPAAPGCILTLSPTGEDVEVSGSSTLSAPNCSVMAASTDDCAINDHDSGGSITAKYLITAGQVSTGQGCNVVNPTSPPSNMQAGLMTGVPSQQFIDPYGSASGTTSFTNSCSSSSYLTHSFLTCNMPAASACVTSLPSVAGGIRYCGTMTIKNATVNLVPSGGIGAITVTNGGNKYSSAPSVTLTGGGGSGFTAVANMKGGGSSQQVDTITITNPGSGYSAPTVTFTGGGSPTTVAAATATVSNGIIWITDGDLALDANGTLECTTCDASTGKGVTIIFTAGTGNKIGAPTMKSNPTIDNLNAPGSGSYEGLLMIQDTVSGASYTTAAKFQGTPGQTLNGLIYAPHSNLDFHGNPSVSNSCLLVVANQLSLEGNSSLATSGCPVGFPLPEVKAISLAS